MPVTNSRSPSLLSGNGVSSLASRQEEMARRRAQENDPAFLQAALQNPQLAGWAANRLQDIANNAQSGRASIGARQGPA